MTKHDTVISALITALEAIETEATDSKRNTLHALSFIRGLAFQARANANAVRIRDTDGYLVVKGD